MSSNFYNPSTGLPNQPGSSGATGGGFYTQDNCGHEQHGPGSGGTSGYGMQKQPQQQWHQQQPGVSPSPSASSAGSSMAPGATNQNMQQQAQQTNPWNQAAAAAFMSAASGQGVTNDAAFDIGSSAVENIVKGGWARMVPGLEQTMTTLRVYFAVDNRYVKRKIQKVLFPFLSKQWQRLEGEPTAPGQPVQYALPLSDENAPDLYLPLMSLITYVLLCALCYGTAGKFDPEVLPEVTTKCSVTQVLEVLAIRFGFYSMQAPVSFLDLFSYTGYKYLGLSANMLVGLALAHFGYGVTGYYIAFLWTASAASFFMLKTMANNIPKMTAATGPKREVMVLAFAASQFATMLFVSQTKFLRSDPAED